MNKIKEIVSYSTKFEVINAVLLKDKSKTIKFFEYTLDKYKMIQIDETLYIYDKFKLLK